MPRLAANITLLFTEYPFLDRFAAAADHGFTGVEISVFPMKSNGDPHPFIFARKAGENGS